MIANRFRFAVTAAAATTVLPVYCSFVVLTIYEGKGRRPESTRRRRHRRRQRVEPIAISENGPRERGRRRLRASGAIVARSGRVCFGSAKTQQPRLNVPRILEAVATRRRRVICNRKAGSVVDTWYRLKVKSAKRKATSFIRKMVALAQ